MQQAAIVLALASVLTVLPVFVAWRAALRARAEAQRQAALLRQEVAARDAAESALRGAKETAEAASLAKSKYVRGISHELRSPLNAVLGYAQLLESSPGLPADLRHSVRVIRRSGAHLSDLVDGLLDISMIEAGKLQIYRDDVAFPEFLNQIVDMFSLQARQSGLDFVFDPPPRLPAMVRADEKRLKQVLINLLSNAVRNTRIGTVTLRVRFSGAVCRFDVEDTGIGIAEEDLQRIFLPFERVARSGQTRRGAGLGLTISKLLTEGMGGELSAVSTPGAGSCFSVRLLLTQSGADVRAPDAPQSAIIGYRGARRTVLVADDDPDHVGFVTAALSGLGFAVIAAHDGSDCVAAATSHAPDIVLLDVSMPDLSGWSAAAALSAQAGPQGRPRIVMVSADPRAESQRSASAADHDAYLMKPLELRALLDAIGGLLDLQWIYALPDTSAPASGEPGTPSAEDMESLRALGRIGHVRGILRKLEEMDAARPAGLAVTAPLRRLAEDCDLDGYQRALERMETP